MQNTIIGQIEAEQMSKSVPEFSPGDTVVVEVRVVEGERERLQAYEGVVIGKRNRGLNSAFTVRKISHGVGVERTFQTYSPAVASIQIKRRGDVRQAKLYYLRELSGKASQKFVSRRIVSRETLLLIRVSERARPGWRSAKYNATEAPAEKPATWAWARPSASRSAATSSAIWRVSSPSNVLVLSPCPRISRPMTKWRSARAGRGFFQHASKVSIAPCSSTRGGWAGSPDVS